jgi:hypothetical protein
MKAIDATVADAQSPLAALRWLPDAIDAATMASPGNGSSNGVELHLPALKGIQINR